MVEIQMVICQNNVGLQRILMVDSFYYLAG